MSHTPETPQTTTTIPAGTIEMFDPNNFEISFHVHDKEIGTRKSGSATPSPKPVSGESQFMSNFNIMTEEIAEIDETITLLKSKREKLVATAAKRKAAALCAEMRKKKSK